MFQLVHSILTLFSVALVFIAFGTLVWFLYSFFLRRFVRARRIANLRLKRFMDETQEQSRRD